MTEEQKKIHRQFAVDCFNATWELLDKKDRTAEDDLEMIHTTHASRYHWGRIGSPAEFQKGEWQIARVYSILGMGEQALFHAEECYRLITGNELEPFDRAAACEAMARAHHVLGNAGKRDIFIRKAEAEAEAIEDSVDKEFLLTDLASIIT